MTDHYKAVQDAARRLRGIAHQTPVITSKTLDERVGAQVLMKCENFQRTGAFKIRGAYNAISQLTPEAQARGIITYSSGNHAQAVAIVCQMLGIPATIVMPHNAPQSKRDATEGYGATVVPYDPDETVREELGRKLAAEHGYTLIPPYDHLDVVHGQGTAALELMQAFPEIEILLVSTGGGGLLSGSAIAAKGISPRCTVIGIEPDLADDATRSFRTGELQTVYHPPTIADGTRTPSLGKITFPLVLEYVDDMQTVSEEAIKAAVRFLFYRTKLVVEPSGALPIAALLQEVIPLPQSKTPIKIGVILCGGNIDGATMAMILGETSALD